VEEDDDAIRFEYVPAKQLVQAAAPVSDWYLPVAQ
jgi:hypothetical protein